MAKYETKVTIPGSGPAFPVVVDANSMTQAEQIIRSMYGSNITHTNINRVSG